MDYYGCPVTQRNRDEHDLFRNKLAAMDIWIRSEGVSLVEVIELKAYLEE